MTKDKYIELVTRTIDDHAKPLSLDDYCDALKEIFTHVEIALDAAKSDQRRRDDA